MFLGLCTSRDLRDEAVLLALEGENVGPLHVSDSLVNELYWWSDALLMPSVQEGFGLPLLEAGLAATWRPPVWQPAFAPAQVKAGRSPVASPDGEYEDRRGFISRRAVITWFRPTTCPSSCSIRFPRRTPVPKPAL